jgi:DNA end-binding protein Ku
MAARATWKGVLQISLVRIPIKVFQATESSETLSFNQLHAACQTRINQRRWCLTCGREVPSAEIVKGFEFEKGKYVILLEDELDAVQPISTKVIDLVQFAAATEVPWTALDRAYFLQPDGEAATQAYGVLRAAMAGRVGIGKLAIYGREYLVAVGPQPRCGLMLFTLHHASELRAVEALPSIEHTGGSAESGLARQVIASLTRPLNLVDFTDAYQTDLRRLIDAKIAGKEIVIPPVETPPVVNLKEALTQSLAAVRATKTPVKAAIPPKRTRA